jgi:ParB family chromosome partitioning protein
MALGKKGLGRGFESLIPTDLVAEEFDPTRKEDKKMSKLVELEITEVVRDEGQPRKNFDKAALEELASSIKEHGVLQPIVVVKQGGKYQIVAGERRWRASQLAGKTTIPAIVRTLDAQNKLELSIIENAQREDLNAIELATAYAKLKEQFNLTNEEIGKHIEEYLEIEGCAICELFVDIGQVFEPKPSAMKLEDGTLISPPMEDMAPFLPREELKKIMLIPLVGE